MIRTFAALLALCPLAAFAAEGHIFRFGGNVPATFTSSAQAAGGTVTSQHTEAGIAVVRGLSDDEAERLAATTGAVDSVADVGVHLRLGTLGDQVEDESVPVDLVSPADAIMYPYQWHLRAIGAEQAWNAGRLGSPKVTVAVIDTGVSYEHVDLVGRVDLSRSVSFVPSDDADVAALFPGKHPVTDLYYHGTHVAATISSNAHVAAGVTANVTIMGVKVLSRWGEGTFSGVLEGVIWAADHGADVANMSIGDAMFKSGNGRYAAMMQRAFNYAHRKGTLMVVAAGNESIDLDHDRNLYKMYCDAPNVVCVSATGPDDEVVWYSNFGRSAITVAAPGGTINDRVWAACSRTSLLVPFCQDYDEVLGLMGTSMAAPHVSGLAALLVEDIGPGKPSQVKVRLQQSAEDLGARGTDPFYGKGRISVPRALKLQ
ncbi:MAG: S8 family serine peptidase [Thermoanaerobaculia bacterium]